MSTRLGDNGFLLLARDQCRPALLRVRVGAQRCGARLIGLLMRNVAVGNKFLEPQTICGRAGPFRVRGKNGSLCRTGIGVGERLLCDLRIQCCLRGLQISLGSGNGLLIVFRIECE